MHRVSALSLAILMFPGIQASAAEIRSLPLPAGESRITAVRQEPAALTFRAQVGELVAMDVQTPAGPFTRLQIPGFHASRKIGEPELPQMNRLIAVPEGARVRLEIQAVRTREVELEAWGVRHRLMPAQPPMPKNVDPEQRPFAYEPAAYAVDVIEPKLVRVVELGRLRALKIARVELCPVTYDLRRGRLRVVESIDFRVIFEDIDEAAQRDVSTRTASPFFEPVYARLANAKSLHDSYPDRVGDVVAMVVVTPPEFEPLLQDFVAWKTERGFQMILAVLGSPEVGSTTTTIQSYLHGLYNSPPPGLPAPSFVLLVGDVEQTPTFSINGDATDRPYCAVDGDLVPDMYYGRFSATNASQLQAILDKTLMYDQYTMPDPSYLAEVVMIAGMDSYYGSTWANGQINYGTTYYFNASHGLSSHTYLYPESGGQSSAIIGNVSDGVAYINYTAHGSQTAWADPSFTQADINGLSNSGRYCLAVGNCCLTGTFDYGECFAETWLRVADKGAIGYIGASNSTYWDEDYWWGVGSTASITVNPTFEASGTGAYDGLFHDHGQMQDLWYVTNDAIIFCGNLAVMEAGGSSTYYWNIYNLMGDPSLSTYLGVPAANPVTTSALNPSAITVNATPGSYVGLTQNGTLVGAGQVDTGGSVAIDFITAPDPGQPLHLVVTAQNREPFVNDIELAAPTCSLSVESVVKSMAPNRTDSEFLQILNVGEPNSQLTFTVQVRGDPPGKSISGSEVVCNESTYLPGQTADLGFIVANGSTDYEWLTDVALDFPAGVTVLSSQSFTGGSGGPLLSDGATGEGATVAWHGDTGAPNYWGVVQGGESASATVSLAFDAGLSGELTIEFTIEGDAYGSNPHVVSGSIILSESSPLITLLAPNGDEQLGIGETTALAWSSEGALSNVRIDLSRDNGGGWESIAGPIPNDGLYDWTVTGPVSAACLIRVSSNDGEVSDRSDAVFAIYQPVPWLTVTPAAGSVAQGEGQTLELRFDSSGLSPGSHTGYVIIEHDAAGSPAVVPITLQITDMTGAPEAPATFALRGNWPNPFNPATAIAFDLPTASDVSLEVLDLRGYHVRTIWQGELPAGPQRILWDGLDDRGQAVSSGLYVARLQAGGELATHKMLLAR
jgi:hypothetical protein